MASGIFIKGKPNLFVGRSRLEKSESKEEHNVLGALSKESTFRNEEMSLSSALTTAFSKILVKDY
jgi:hypothetical protein